MGECRRQGQRQCHHGSQGLAAREVDHDDRESFGKILGVFLPLVESQRAKRSGDQAATGDSSEEPKGWTEPRVSHYLSHEHRGSSTTVKITSSEDKRLWQRFTINRPVLSLEERAEHGPRSRPRSRHQRLHTARILHPDCYEAAQSVASSYLFAMAMSRCQGSRGPIMVIAFQIHPSLDEEGGDQDSGGAGGHASCSGICVV